MDPNFATNPGKFNWLYLQVRNIGIVSAKITSKLNRVIATLDSEILSALSNLFNLSVVIKLIASSSTISSVDRIRKFQKIPRHMFTANRFTLCTFQKQSLTSKDKRAVSRVIVSMRYWKVLLSINLPVS